MPPRQQQSLKRAPFQEYILEDGRVWTEFYRAGSGYLLRFPGLADFEVSADGTEVVSYPLTDGDEATVDHLYINQLVPLALSRQGHPTFHASVVTVPNGCVAFLGSTGMGKSTLAASFALENAAFLTDDALIIDESDGIRAMPSHPSLRLWDDSVEALVPKDSPTAAAISYSSKPRLLAGDALAYQDRPQPLLAAFVLLDDDTSNITICQLAGAQRQMAWVRNSFLLDIEDKALVAQHYEWTHRISDKLPTFTLDYPRHYGMLPDVRDAIRRHVANL